MTLAQMQARFFELKGKLAVGQIQEEEFKRELEKLRFQDSQGRWWMLGAQSGRWYYYDGARWLLGDPPEPPPPALGAGEPIVVIPPASQTRTTSYSQPVAAQDATTDSAQTISAPYTYAPAQPVARPVAPPPQPQSTQPNPPPNNGSYTAPPTHSASAPSTPSPAAPKPSLGETLHHELGKVRMPHVEMPHVQMPNVQRPNAHAPHVHVPPQFIPHAPAPIRKYQPPFILIGAVVVGLALVALMWLAVDNFVPGKPISNFFGRALGGTALQQKTPSARPSPTIQGGQNVDNLLRVGDELASKSQFEPAIAQYQAAAKQAPNEADVYTHWARALALTGRIGEAITVAQKATRLDPTSSKAFTELTRALSWAGQTDQAIKAGENAISLDPNNASAKAFLAEAYLRAGRNNDAQDMVNQALELDDANPDTHRAAGWVAILLGHKDEGVGEWKRTIELAPNIFLYQYELGLVYADYLNDPAAAIPAFQNAIQLYPPYIPSYTALGRAYLAANQPGPAILQFQKALTLDPNSSDAFLGLGQAFQLSQKCQQAIPYFQKALELNKDLAAASKGLEDCGAIAKGSAPPIVPTEIVLAPVATAVPQATVAPINGASSITAQPTSVANSASTDIIPAGKARIYFPVYDGQYHIYSANPDGSDRQIVVDLASSPSVSPDGTQMLYYSWVNDQRGIHRIGVNGANDLHISLRAEDTLPAWSPDGAKYIYATRAGQGGDINKRAFTLRVSSTGSKPRQDPPPLVVQAQYPAWGPNDRIAFRDCGFPDETCGIAVINADGSGKKVLTPGMNATAPAWSPDGSRIVFMSNAAGNWDLYSVSADGGSPQRLTDDPADDGLPTFSPDGSKIAYVTKRGGTWSIWQMDPDGENETKLFDLGGDIAGTIPGNSPAQPGQTWLDQRISWR
jgi:tetratricopeptide (TPR) repeat protein